MAEESQDNVQDFTSKSFYDGEKVNNPDKFIIPKPQDEPSDNIDIYTISKIIQTWGQQHQSDIELRKKYAGYLLWLLIIESVLMLLVFIAIGLQWLSFTEHTVQLFLTLSIGQIVGMTFIIVKYLFSKDSHVILRDIAEVIGRIRK